MHTQRRKAERREPAVYTERAVAPGTIWTRTTSTASAGEYRVLPDGCLDVISLDGELIIAGPDTGAHLAFSPADTRYVGLRFAPGVGPAVLGVPAAELRDQRVPLDAVWPAARVRALRHALEAADDPGAVLARTFNGIQPDPWVPATVGWLRAGRSVRDIAADLERSERQLHRRCLHAFGYGPKTLARILRLGRALSLLRRGLTPAEAAAVAGYADQPHLARDVRALAGVPLTSVT
jgi:AraC-like DNA-binding protein